MCIVCGPGGSRLVHSIAASFGAPGGRNRPRFMAEEVAPAFAPPLDPADLGDLKGPSDVILRGGPILTMRGEEDVAQAIAVRAGRIQSVGEEATVLAHRGRLTRIIDLDGRAVLPGFVVADWHPPISLLCDWFEAEKTPPPTLAAAIADRSDEWLALRFHGSAEDRSSLSILLAAACRPAVMIDETGWVLTANAAAMTLSPELAAAVPEKRSQCAHISALLPAFLGRLNVSRDPLRVRLRALLIDTSRNGVTMLRFCGLGLLTGRDDLNLLQSAAGDSPPLRLRGSVDASLVLAASLRAGLGNDTFRVDTATRWIDEASANTPELAEAVSELRKRGWRVTLHANSSEAIDVALEAFSIAASVGTPLGVADGVEHRVPLSPEACARLRSLGISAGLLIEGGTSPIDGIVNSVNTRGIPISVGLDQIAGPSAPLRTVASVARSADFGQRIGDYLHTVTRDAAMRSNVAPIIGCLEVGMHADFAFLDEDPRDIAPKDFASLRCVATWVSGREICP